MSNPLLAFWHVFVGRPPDAPEDDELAERADRPTHAVREPTSLPIPAAHTGAIFLIMRRMRAPLIVLILVFSISALGLTIIPGTHPDGSTTPMSIFHSLYFVTYTATTIGFGEIPDPLSTPQRLWVTVSIYWMVIGWAYAIGTVLALVQDRNFRREVAVARFTRQVRRMPEPFLVLLGYGGAGSLVAHELDRRGRRLVLVDRNQERIDALDLAELRNDVPALSANVRVVSTLQLAGLEHPRCAGVLALTDDDEANLGAVQAAALLRPGLPVVARAANRAMAERMRAFGEPTVVDPFDAFGDRLRVILRTPALAQLFDWLVSPRGDPPPPRAEPPDHGQWVVIGHSRSVVELAVDLTAAGVPVVELDPAGPEEENPGSQDPRYHELIAGSVGLVAAADRETTNVSYIESARRVHPGLFVVARQERRADTAIFQALAPDMLMIPSAVVAREVLERLANPALWDFLMAAKNQGNAWAAQVLDAIVERSGRGSPDVWQVTLNARSAPALVRRIEADAAMGHHVRLGELTGSPFARGERLPITVLMLKRGATNVLMPLDEVRLRAGDVLLVAGGPGARRGWDATLGDDEALGYVLAEQEATAAWWAQRRDRPRRR